ncbi:hypothetical protein GCM10011387_20170 [Pedobacter quisquiliarum]|uniref:histidine kinase n=1 Tax=Pedobacter quisquiliarum TaxID=1834438 RepID=A0A916UAN3_9SPHI|nr:tetratricopeptide repeat protein [Pedobacter quisquiliarum]GGC66718.1 hypothetical protein GCM10011387_20170 [Pedobacter quisquiliarum]
MERISKFLFFAIIAGLLSSSCSNKEQSLQGDIEVPKRSSHPLTQQAYTLLDSGELDSAFIIFNQARAIYLQKRDSFMLGTTLTNMALIATEAGDSFNGQEYSLEALKFFNAAKEAHSPYILSNLNNLGIASYDLKKYKASLEFYKQASSFIIDSAALHISKNNIANAYRELGQYDTAIKIYGEVLARNPVEVTKARTLTNLAKTRWLKQARYNPIPVYMEALEIRKNVHDLWGENSSYSHLVSFYKRSNRDSALHYSDFMYKLALKLRNPDNELETLSYLAELAPSNPFYLKRYLQLQDSLSTVRNAAKNQFALIRYETEKHKSENLKLERENTQQQVDILRRTVGLWAAAFGLIATVSIFSLRYRRRKRQLAEQADRAIRESKLKTSKEIHDVVANGLYRMMSELEYGDEINKEKLIDQIENLYEKSRGISHLVVAEPAKLSAQLYELGSSFSNEHLSISMVGLQEDMDLKINERIGNELLLIVQELLVNMKKHSAARSVVLRFEIDQDRLNINYRDDGVGLEMESTDHRGLFNIESRIEELSGRCKFDHHEHGGLQVAISVPLNV